MRSAKILFWSAVAYSIILLATREILPSESTPTVFLVGVPLIVVAIIIARDLALRSTIPSATSASIEIPRLKENPVEFLSGQIRLATSASNSYFENVLRSRLRELLVSKVALETGLDASVVRQTLKDPARGVKLLDDPDLYATLYGPAPQASSARIRSIEQAMDMIGAWNE